jgi:hypothetical protein
LRDADCGLADRKSGIDPVSHGGTEQTEISERSSGREAADSLRSSGGHELEGGVPLPFRAGRSPLIGLGLDRSTK